jgi:Family of unknown function (DUF6502)
MAISNQQRLLGAVRACLGPIARILIRSGVSFRQFSEMSKAAFVDEVLAERDSQGRRTNTSRIAVRTGLSRKEVARLLKQSRSGDAGANERVGAGVHFHQAARVLQLWHNDARFVRSNGLPKELAFDGSSDSFSALVKCAGGDVPPGAVRAELFAASAIDETEAGLLRALKRYYVPGDIGEELIAGLALIVFPVIAGLARNIEQHGGETFIQRVAFTNRLVPAAMPLFRKVARVRTTEFVQSIDDWLSSNEDPTLKSQDSGFVAVGTYYYEGLLPDMNVPERHLATPP